MKETAEMSQRICYYYKISNGFLLQDNGDYSWSKQTRDIKKKGMAATKTGEAVFERIRKIDESRLSNGTVCAVHVLHLFTQQNQKLLGTEHLQCSTHSVKLRHSKIHR